MCFYISLVRFLTDLTCFSSNISSSSKLRIFIEIILTLFSTQVLNFAFDELIFVGLGKILENIFNPKKPEPSFLRQLMPEVSFFVNTKIYAIPLLRVFSGKYFQKKKSYLISLIFNFF